MKKTFTTLFLVWTIFLSGCASIITYSETVPNTDYVKHSRVSTTKGKSVCFRKETHITRSSSDNSIIEKEIRQYDCSGYLEKLVDKKIWKRENGKLVRIKQGAVSPSF